MQKESQNLVKSHLKDVSELYMRRKRGAPVEKIRGGAQLLSYQLQHLAMAVSGLATTRSFAEASCGNPLRLQYLDYALKPIRLVQATINFGNGTYFRHIAAHTSLLAHGRWHDAVWMLNMSRDQRWHTS